MESRGPVAIEYRRLESDVESMAIPVGTIVDFPRDYRAFPFSGCGGGL